MVLLVFVCINLSFFFFKQKTAYELRISDWSSDVCSSDLERFLALFAAQHDRGREERAIEHGAVIIGEIDQPGFDDEPAKLNELTRAFAALHLPFPRSEEHTSELQSLMRISYAVFCLKTKKTKNKHTSSTTMK